MLSTLSSERTKYVVFFIAFFLALPILHAQVPSYVPSNGLVGYWPFNGNADDASGNGNNGTLGNVMSVPDRFGNSNGAYYLNDSKITLASNFNVASNQSYTFSAWVKIDHAEECLVGVLNGLRLGNNFY
jgi:hypothetical protein